MGKITLTGPVPKDDPMFSTGPELISRHESSESSTNSVSDTNGVTQEKSNSANALFDLWNQPEDPALGAISVMQDRRSSQVEREDEGKDLGSRRIARFKHQNEQMRKQSKD